MLKTLMRTVGDLTEPPAVWTWAAQSQL